MTPPAKPSAAGDLPVLFCALQAEWAQWLAAEHTQSSGVWLKMAKKDSGIASVNYAQALEVALCFGWIDGQKKALDAQHWLQKFTRRGARSIWSKVNRDKVLLLIEQGKMQPAGHLEIAAAQRDGRWDAAYDSASTAQVPPAFQAALDACPAAKAFFDTLNSRNRYAMLFRLQTAKKAETRERNIAKFIDMLTRGESFHIL